MNARNVALVYSLKPLNQKSHSTVVSHAVPLTRKLVQRGSHTLKHALAKITGDLKQLIRSFLAVHDNHPPREFHRCGIAASS